jgi:hypothetical protein
MTRRLYIPHTLTQEVAFECAICGAGFTKDQLKKFDDHMGKCAHSDEAQKMEQFSPRVKYPFFSPEFGDVEFESWIKQNRKGIIDGRTKM